MNTIDGSAASQPRRSRLARIGLNPYVQLAVGSMLVMVSELLLKKGATAAPAMANVPNWLGVSALASAWTWLGILCYILSFISWLHVLRFLPLSIAFSLASIVHVLVPLGAWLVLGEQISPRRWIGIALILAGIMMIAGNVANAEEKL